MIKISIYYFDIKKNKNFEEKACLKLINAVVRYALFKKWDLCFEKERIEKYRNSLVLFKTSPLLHHWCDYWGVDYEVMEKKINSRIAELTLIYNLSILDDY